MRATLIGLTLSMALSGAALAQTTIITEEPPMGRPGGSTVIVDPAPDRAPAAGSVPSTPPGCASTTTRQDAPDGTTTTVRKERCNPEND